MLDGDEESQELNRFLSTNRVLQVERHFVSDGSRSAWAVCVSYLDRGGRPAHEQGQGKRVDYREILSESDFAVYAKLRSLRKSMAENDGLQAWEQAESNLPESPHPWTTLRRGPRPCHGSNSKKRLLTIYLTV
jgi:hypothetical protein